VRIAWRKDLPAGTYSSLAPLMVSGLLRPKVELAGRCVGSDVCQDLNGSNRVVRFIARKDVGMPSTVPIGNN